MDELLQYANTIILKKAKESAAKIAGLSPSAPTVTNAHGAKQSHVPYRCDLLPALATLHIAAILDEGSKKYGDNNWRKIPVADHVNHALTHLFAHLAGDASDDHMGHAGCRLLMALEKHLEEAHAP